MAANNARAFRFYTKLGFIVLDKDQDAIWLGKKLA
jgi:ribosomal protein S18 acetylase RimI-like enzyme